MGYNSKYVFLQWLPLLKDHRLQTGEFCLPITVEYPPSNYSYIPPDVLLPGIKWVDNHKSLFTVCVESVSSIHTGVIFVAMFWVSIQIGYIVKVSLFYRTLIWTNFSSMIVCSSMARYQLV